MDELIKELDDARENSSEVASLWVHTRPTDPAYDERWEDWKDIEAKVSMLRYRIQLEANGHINQAAKLLAALDK